MVDEWNDDGPLTGTFRGQRVWLQDALMELTKDELAEVVVTRPDGTTYRPYRFSEVDPKVSRDEDGILSF